MANNTYVCLVDKHRRHTLSRNTQGRYLVSAKNQEDAKKRLQKAIGFGSVQVYYKVEREIGTDRFIKSGEIFKVEPTGDLMMPRHATDPIVYDD